MRKITEDAINCFECKKSFKRSNTRVAIEDGETRLYLHDNLIAKEKEGITEISHAGWPTRTTQERLNGFDGVHIKLHRGEFSINDESSMCGRVAWDGKWRKI